MKNLVVSIQKFDTKKNGDIKTTTKGKGVKLDVPTIFIKSENGNVIKETPWVDFVKSSSKYAQNAQIPASLFVGMVNEDQTEDYKKLDLWKDVEKKVDKQSVKLTKGDNKDRVIFGVIAREAREGVDDSAKSSWGYTTQTEPRLSNHIKMPIRNVNEFETFKTEASKFFRNNYYNKGTLAGNFLEAIGRKDVFYNPGKKSLAFVNSCMMGKVLDQYVYPAVNGNTNDKPLDEVPRPMLNNFGKYIGYAAVYGGGGSRVFFTVQTLAQAIARHVKDNYENQSEPIDINVVVQAMYDDGNPITFNMRILDCDENVCLLDADEKFRYTAIGIEGDSKYYVAGIGDMLY